MAFPDGRSPILGAGETGFEPRVWTGAWLGWCECAWKDTSTTIEQYGPALYPVNGSTFSISIPGGFAKLINGRDAVAAFMKTVQTGSEACTRR
jgi:hypothetical protein